MATCSSSAVPLELHEVTKRFDRQAAVDSLTLEVPPGEFLTLLGPSGCGKTTTLRMVAGFVRPDHGSIVIGGRDVTQLAPERRDIGIVFQSYALFPHLTVNENVAYGLRMRHVSAADRRKRVDEVLETVRLSALAQRYPRQLSGGQQQRVALARAVVIRPSVLLLDEPLSNLDAKLRQEMRFEIRTLQQSVGITTIFVTHDQEEALTMSDRIAVMANGRIEQLGSPRDVYQHPRTPFVAGFIGNTNLWEATVRKGGTGEPVAIVPGLPVEFAAPPGIADGARVLVSLRPEAIILRRAGTTSDVTAVTGTIEAVSYLGSSMDYRIRIGQLLVRVVSVDGGVDNFGSPLRSGDEVNLAWDADSCRLIDL